MSSTATIRAATSASPSKACEIKKKLSGTPVLGMPVPAAVISNTPLLRIYDPLAGVPMICEVHGTDGPITLIVRSALVMNGPLRTEQRRAYAPLVENKAVVFAAFVLPKATMPGPLSRDHMILDALATVACRINPTPAGTLAGE